MPAPAVSCGNLRGNMCAYRGVSHPRAPRRNFAFIAAKRLVISDK
jgi:hypothetical protein